MADVEQIKAIIREELDWPAERDPDGAVSASLSRIASRIAALRSKGREDGAREMRERAAEAARLSQPVPADRERYALNEAARAIRALPLTTRTEDGDDD